MELMLQRNLQHSRWTPTQYLLNVTLLLDQDEMRTATRNQLTRFPLYEAPLIQVHEQDAKRALERSENSAWTSVSAVEESLINLTEAAFHKSRAFLSFRLRVREAIAGATITCNDFFSLLSCEEEVTSNFDQFQRYLEHATAFETAREQRLLPDATAEPEGVPPAAWADHANWRR